MLTALWLISTNVIGAEQNQRPEEELQGVNSAIAEIQSWLEQANGRQSKSEEQLRLSEIELSSLTLAQTETESAIAKLASRLSRLNDSSQLLQQQKSSQTEQLHGLIRNAYIAGEQSFLKLLLNQEDPAKSARMLHYYRLFSASQLQQVQKFQQTLDELATVNLQLQSQSQQLSTEQARLQQQGLALEQAKSERQLALLNLENEIISQSMELEQLEIAQHELQELIEQINRALERIPASSPTGPFEEQKGKLPLPLAGSIVANFGARLGQSDLRRQGIVISVEEGTAVQAIHGGRVVFADWLRGSGLLLIVDHGGGYMSLYGANQALSISAGEQVNAGDIVASSGNTSYFEIRYRGQAIDPGDWIDSNY